MYKLLIDAGTSWSKVLELYTDEDELRHNYLDEIRHYITDSYGIFTDKEGNSFKGRLYLFPSSLLSKIQILFDIATGHMIKNKVKTGGKYENEIISLACGAKKILNVLGDYTIIDLGSRDIKWVKFKEGKYKDLDWNGNCGSSTGATVEMLCKFYNVDPNKIEIQKEKIPITCGVFAMEKIMDLIASDIPAEIAVAKYMHGIAFNTWNFAGKPEKVYFSGGFWIINVLWNH